MGSSKAATALPELKRQNLIDKLIEKGIRTIKDGTSIYDLNDRALAHELALHQYRERNVESSENSWF